VTEVREGLELAKAEWGKADALVLHTYADNWDAYSGVIRMAREHLPDIKVIVTGGKEEHAQLADAFKQFSPGVEGETAFIKAELEGIQRETA